MEHQPRDNGFYAVGVLSHEAGAAYGLSVSADRPRLPLVWFGLVEPSALQELQELSDGSAYTLDDVRPSVDREVFEAAFALVRHHSVEGDTYRVNYTFRMQGVFSGHAESRFADLGAAQGGRYSRFLDLVGIAVRSASPELFFERAGRRLVTRPMKETAPGGRTVEEDRRQAEALHAKERAEMTTTGCFFTRRRTGVWTNGLNGPISMT